MPLFISIYIIFLIFLLLGNVVFGIKYKAKGWLVCYEFLSGFYLIFLMIAYWTPDLMASLGLANIIAFATVVGFDCYYSLKGSVEDFGELSQAITEDDFEMVKAISVVVTSPAYIVCALAVSDIVNA